MSYSPRERRLLDVMEKLIARLNAEMEHAFTLYDATKRDEVKTAEINRAHTWNHAKVIAEVAEHQMSEILAEQRDGVPTF